MEMVTGNPKWTQYRDQQVMGKPSLSRYICNTAPASMAQGISQKRGQKGCKSQNTRKSALWQTPGNGFINKTGSFNGHVNMEGRKLHVVTPLRTTGNCWLLRVGELTSPRDEPLAVYPIQSDQPWNHVHSTNKSIQYEICIYIHVYM